MKAFHKQEGQRGQALILMVLAMTVIFVAGAIAVDIGLWLSERRGAQTDADFSALAGAWELLDPEATESDAVNAATETLADNDEQGNAELALPVQVDNSCFRRPGRLDAVTVDVDHESESLFAGIFGIGPPDIGAHAKACAGATASQSQIVPFEIDVDTSPCFTKDGAAIFTAMCGVEFEAQDGNPRGILDLEAPGTWCSDATSSGDIEALIVDGAPGDCFINSSKNCDPTRGGPWHECVAVQTGNPKKVQDAVQARVAKDGLCDANFGNNDGTDDFFETVRVVMDTGDPTTSLYEARDCDPVAEGDQISVRLVTIIVLKHEPRPGITGYPIYAFAGFYIAGCAHGDVPVDGEEDLDRDCSTPGTRLPSQADDLYVQDLSQGLAPAPARCHRPAHRCATPTTSATPSATPAETATPTATATPTPTAVPTETPTPSPSPSPGKEPPGRTVVYGRFVNLIVAGSGVGEPTDATTVFSISLVE